jgi:hypothetical protein
MSESSAEERTATAKKCESERLDNPPLWSPCNFQKQSDWHQDFYGEMRSQVVEALPEAA